MGIGPAGRELYEKMMLKPPAWVCDLGSQDMSLFESISAREWMERQGFNYTCIDQDGKYGAMKLDLNTATHKNVGGIFDIVTNHGTSEHVFNQANVFELMHNITDLGGLMIHAVPTLQFGRPHGFYFYDKTIFKDLAYTNNSDILHMYRRSEPCEIILVAMRKLSNSYFKMPIQGMYRDSV